MTRDAVPERPRRNDSAEVALASTFFFVSYQFYRHVLSPIDGPTCMHRPTCSRYALLAIRKHPVLGLMLTVDRLWRSINSSALRLLPLTHEEFAIAFLDPLEESDFWLRPSH